MEKSPERHWHRARQEGRGGLLVVLPTILAMLGLRIPDDAEGAVITDLFDPPAYYETEAASHEERQTTDDEVYSQEEQRVLTERLADLGYLE